MQQINDCPHQLVHVTDNDPGFTRHKWGRGFIYKDCRGKKISDKEILARISKLVIPPMWDKVWICPQENGHMQVTGYDVKGRKQYIYHKLWVYHRQNSKYGKLGEFGTILPVIRRKIEKDINLKGWPKEKILSLIVMLLDAHYIRIGNRYYEKENKTYGLTTLRRKHLAEKNGKLYLSYKAKSGKYREVQIASKKLVKLIKKISELPGYEIFKYQDENKTIQRLDSQEVNRYLEIVSGDCFTAKDFRTWGGTVLAINYYKEVLEEIKHNPRLNLETNIVKRVAATLGNTVATCKEYYIHPKVLEVLVNDEVSKFSKRPLPPMKYKNELSAHEKLALKIITAR
ncbi:DNA topoisomerase IB [Fulvivirga ulvae]|uniref:DNA topoisomerase IB n=1 Tax=Fulvivirga ulvae TaxID=2904245 RepID=UPI001F165E1C|nr:DNA topoisomerase IB [Fulvivirga ulvae]UII32076.1 DNA topoisomerase IB [Fulvivirga ulvae]